MNRILTALTILMLPGMLFAQEIPQRYVLFEEFTGAWCGWCPRGNLILEELVDEYDRIIPVAIHSGPGFDPMRTDAGDLLTEDLLVWYPTAAIDRYRFDGYATPPVPDSDWREKLLERLQTPPQVSITLDHTYQPATRELTITVSTTFLEGLKGDFSFNAYLIEDEVSGGEIFDQKNYYNENPDYPDLFGRGNPISGYIHRHVLRKMLGGSYGVNPAGDLHIPETVSKGANYQYSFETVLDERFDATRIFLVVYLMITREGGDAEVLNAATGPLLSTSSKEQAMDNRWNLYPNPSEGVIFLDEQGLNSGGDYRVVDLAGRILKSGTFLPTEERLHKVDLHHLESGCYLFFYQEQPRIIYLYR